MVKMTVREVRQRWPAAERALAEEGEVIVTRDGKPVARILPFEPQARPRRARVDWAALDRWRVRFWKRQPKQPSTKAGLAADRADGK